MRQKKLLYSHTSHKYLGLLGILPDITRFGLFTVIMSMTYVFASCSDETALSNIGDETGSVTFYVGSYATTETRSSTVGSTVIQTDSEAQVNELIAVIFTDVSGGGTSGYSSGQTDTEDDDDTYYGYYTLVGDDGVYSSFVLSTSTEMRIEIDDEGYYQICFVANPSSTIKTAIQNLATASANTIADFKALVETQDPATTPMEMTSSTFYGVYSGQDTDLGAVTLKRIMARIDIVNCVDDLVITKAVFKYRATKSTLMRDNSSDWASDGYSYVSTAQKTYTFSYPLIGNESNTSGSAYGIETTTASKVNASKCEIYSYEQYAVANSSSGKGYIPVIVLYYYLTSDKSSVYTHEVSFKDEGLNIQRNYRYKIQVGYDGDTTISTSIDVDDWNYGTVFEVSDSDIIAGLDDYEPSSELEIGDFIMNDGSYVCADDINDGTISTSLFSSSYYPIAIVFYVEDADESPSGSRMGAVTLKAVSSLDGIGGKHGKALSLSAGKSSKQWTIEACEFSTSELTVRSSSASIAYMDYDGYGNCQTIVNSGYGTQVYFPATYSAMNPTIASPTNTTGWYLPAIGEWYDIIDNLTGSKFSSSVSSASSVVIGSSTYKMQSASYEDAENYGYLIYYYTPSGNASVIADKINAAMYVATSTYASPISYGYPTASSYLDNAMGYWTSSEASFCYARTVYFGSEDYLYFPNAKLKTESDSETYSRGVLAF